MESHHLSTLDSFSVISTDREKLMLISSRGIGTVASSSRQQIFTSLDSHAAIATWRTRLRLVLAAVAPGGSGTLPQPTQLPRAVCSVPHASPALIGPICPVLSLSQCLLLAVGSSSRLVLFGPRAARVLHKCVGVRGRGSVGRTKRLNPSQEAAHVAVPWPTLPSRPVSDHQIAQHARVGTHVDADLFSGWTFGNCSGRSSRPRCLPLWPTFDGPSTRADRKLAGSSA